MKSSICLALLAWCLCAMVVRGFSGPSSFGASPAVNRCHACLSTTTTASTGRSTGTHRLKLASDDNDLDQQEKLRKMGYSDEELQRASSSSNRQDENVNVQVVDVDAFSLTAIGFGLIALNFFVFANLGDGGIAGIVARIQNVINS